MKIAFFHIVFCFFLTVDSYRGGHADSDATDCARYTNTPGDAILGEWIDDLKTVRISIYKENTCYHAKVLWLKESALAATGSSLMKNLTYAGSNNWKNGMLFYPRTKSWYQCNCSLATKSLLKLRVFSGIPLLGKTIYFMKTGA
jgi:uncharacterized protein (DUF2147 family)